jgi:hypothetical protein
MIVHVVLFRPRPELSITERQRVLDAMLAAARNVPTVRRCRVGRRVIHGLPGYEQTMREDYQFAAMLEFDDEQGLREYLQHPAHRQIATQFTSAASAALAYDYDLVDVEDGSLLAENLRNVR